MRVSAKPIPVQRTSGVKWYRRRSFREGFQRWFAFALLCGGAALFLAPILWMLASSLKTNQLVFDGRWIPTPAEWSNYPNALSEAPFGLYFRNTAVIAVFSVSGAVLSSSLVAYSFARLEWPFRDTFFVLVLATMLLPAIVTFIPQYILFSKIGWVNTYLPLTVPQWFGNAFYIFLLRQFYRGIPFELSDAARIDGASDFRIWWQIIMPLSRPALAAVTIFAFTGVWEDYFNPLVYLSDPNKFTLQLGLKIFENAEAGGVPQWNYLMAAGFVVMLPVLIVFFLGQRYFIEGVTLSGLKG
jgi:ABC-type glycerol-3-phosphate transport system permease component